MKSETKTYAAMGLLALSLGCLTAVDTWAQGASPIMGDWRAVDGSAVARVAPCRSGPGLCATVIEERSAPGEEATLGQVMVRDLVPSRDGWTGVYGSQGQNLQTRIRLRGPDRIEVRVCANALFCETARYDRVGP